MTEKAYADAVCRFGDMVFRLALVYTKCQQDAEDCSQNVFVKLLHYGDEFQDEGHLKGWLITVTKNECRSLLRSFWNRRKAPLEEAVPLLRELPGGDGALTALVLELPDKYRDILYLHYYEGYKVHEIAALLKLGQSNVKARLSRGRQILRRNMEAQGGCTYESWI